MAYELTLQFFAAGAAEPDLALEPNWWPVKKILAQFPFCQVSDNDDFIQQYELALSELIDLHLDYHSLTKMGVFSYSAWQSQIKPKVALIEKVIAEDLKFNRILMLVREWESGY